MINVFVRLADGSIRKAFMLDVLHIPNAGNFGVVSYKDGDEPLDTIPLADIKLERYTVPSAQEINNRLKKVNIPPENFS